MPEEINPLKKKWGSFWKYKWSNKTSHPLFLYLWRLALFKQKFSILMGD